VNGRTPIAQSALHPIYEAQQALTGRSDGWHIPLHFGSAEAEIEAARTAAAATELIGGSVLDLVGEALSEAAAHLGVAQVPVGAAAPAILPGGEEARWLRLTRRHARLLVARGAAATVREALRAGESCLHLREVSSGLTTLAVLGLRSPDLLARLFRPDLDPRVFADRSVAMTGAVGVPVQVLRWDRGPLLAYELTVTRDVAEYFWEALAHAGQDLGLKAIGAEAFRRLMVDGELVDG
jgi:glycine cleavage system aminomethyltransferase T